MTADDDDDNTSDNDNLSSVSTILGLALFCLLLATILIRRLMVHRAGRMYALQRLLSHPHSNSNTNIVGGGGVGWARSGIDSFGECWILVDGGVE
jgi:hypothetical protein